MTQPGKRLEGLRVAVLATHGVEESELVEPRKALIEAGARVDVLAPEAGQIQAFQHMDKSRMIDVDRSLAQAYAADYDAVMLPGGAVNADKIRTQTTARTFVSDAQKAGKPIAAICHAPWLLVSAGLVEGRKLTSDESLQDDIRNAGGDWVDQGVTVDGNLVTSRKPDDIPAFNREMTEVFARTTADREREKQAAANSTPVPR
ncbi:MAG: DJ-1/PfpI/YhbO family deglycase/protease [Dehalococcoidia bacterium]|nr:DJ-1/PfpI/YhbO family deglycase/protease [Dehalococcoidia bacterium]